ncbi:MAG TPA: DUF5655 domain-containing protein [Gemmataceae bacterium]|jgi:hypothetical protein|nr:DUF5655 domain-containing protein [Gemmataceae bacterium]
MGLMRLQAVDLKRENLSERLVQDEIAADPSVLGLGDDLELRGKERIQPSAGRLDLLLQDTETLKRYEVEIQLGPTDESHIIRTIEYWDIERKLYPQYEHAAVIVAEDITSRFLNVIQLFNGAIPLVALKMTAYKVGDQYALTFVKVVDERKYGLVGEDEPTPAPTDRPYWVLKGSERTLAATDALLKLVKEVQPKAALRYTKHYIGIEVDGSTRNFVTFRPRKAHVIMNLKLPPQGEETRAQLEEAGTATLAYDSHFGYYRIGIDPSQIEKQRTVLLELIRHAWEGFGKA